MEDIFITGLEKAKESEIISHILPKKLCKEGSKALVICDECRMKQCREALTTIAASWNCVLVKQGNDIYCTDSSLEETLSQIRCIRTLSVSWHHVAVTTCHGDGYVIHKDDCIARKVVFDTHNKDTLSGKCLFSNIKTGDTHMIGVSEEGMAGLITMEGEKTPVFRAFTPALRVRQVSVGKEHALLLSTCGVLYTYGIGSRGQLGHDSIENSTVPEVVAALEPLRIVSVSAGGWHSAAVSDIGDVYVWGWNESGQLGLPNQSISRTEQQRSADDFVNVQCSPRVLDVPSLLEADDTMNVRKVSCGARHTVILTENGDVYSCGWNKYGQLGHGDNIHRDKLTRIEFFDENLSKHKIVDIACGGWSTLLQMDKGQDEDKIENSKACDFNDTREKGVT